ncbi:HAD family hydrolase [Virgibacillus halodenitrificans]|uniref:HAD family hydrolase n=1 Tax=Virgibacillus halodenitrificans TaxID=1482 RepID=UPI002DD42C50|nr:HAD-IA family hydrolase [Virgibacillus halodenitrificans]
MKTVVFDLDGTLLNRDESLKIFIEKQYERLDEWLFHIPKDNYIKRFIELDNRGYVWKDKVYQQLINEYDIVGFTWEELLQDYLTYFKESCIPFSNLISVLERIKRNGGLIGIITNGKGQFQMDNIQALGIDKYTDTILISEWEGVKKPDPEIFKAALQRLEVSAEESVLVGDHPKKDIKAAQCIGMKTI